MLGALRLHLDDAPPLRLQPVASSFPDVAALGGGEAQIIIRAEAGVPRLPVGPHRLLFHNQHAADSSVYLANALVPEDDQVAVTEQQRTADQSELTIEFVVRERLVASRQWVWIGLAGVFMLAASLARRA